MLWRHAKIFKNQNNEFEYCNKLDELVVETKEEKELDNYLKTVAKMNYGLTQKNAHELAFKYVQANEMNMPSSWIRDQGAGKEWLRYFVKTHPNLSIRKPETTSLARSSGFNKSKIKDFFFKS